MKKERYKRIGIIAGIAAGGLALLGILGFTVALAWISRDLPDPNALMGREVPLTTKIYDRTGEQLLYEIHGDQNRTLIQIKDLPTYVPHAAVAVEDKNFYQHSGIDWKGLVRAVVVNTFKGRRIQGTSTLTQQFVRNAILTTERSYVRKLKEILLSLQMERVFTKDQILQLYLNEIPYGSTMYGIESAARGYFGKGAKDLTMDEAALLAALPQGPDLYNPYGTGTRGDNRKTLVGRQHLILDLMAEQGYVKKEEAEEAKKVDTLAKLIPKKESGILAPHFVMYVRSMLIEKYGQTTVEQKGLKVITTLDWKKQQIAQEEVVAGVDKYGKDFGFTSAALVGIDPKNGQILSMVGSKDFNDDEHDGQVNVAIRPRQPGSSFKPIVYAAGLLKGFTPETTIWDVNTTFKTDSGNYEPKNYDFKEHGPVSLRMALDGSLNIPAVKMLYLVGVGRVLDFAENLGYSTFADRSRFGLALVLGGGEVKLLEHTNAYASFANEGVQFPTSAILKVEDSSGAALEEWKQPEGKSVLERGTALWMSNILSDNNARAYVFGTNNHLTLPGRPVAAKTGTTNDFNDAWAMGYTPSLAAGVWVGNANDDEMKRGADGSKIAAPIWQAYMKRSLEGTPAESFPTPPPIATTKPILQGKASEVKIKIDKVTGKRATEFTPADLVEERTFREAHTILWYIDKDDPTGPAPTDPTQDPQFWNWENAVQTWVQKNNWNTTSTAPTEYDDVHTAEGRPAVTILSPVPNTTLTSRNFTVNVNASTQRRITHVEVSSEGVVLANKISEPWTFDVSLPNSIDRGFHDIKVIAYDDVGSQGTASVTVNLNAEAAPISVKITNIQNNSTIHAGEFPIAVSTLANELSGAQKIDLYLQTNDGSTRLLGSSIAPTTNDGSFVWSFNPGPGSVKIFAVLTDSHGETHVGEQLTLTIVQ
jgi:penicillin-binding protein 1C